VKQNILSGYEKSYEVTALRKNGTTFPAEIQGRMMNYHGRRLRVTALRDITDRKHAALLEKAECDLGLQVSKSSSLQEALEICLDMAIQISRMDCGGIYLVNDNDRSLKLSVHYGLSDEFTGLGNWYSPDSDNAKIIYKGVPVYAEYQQLGIDLDEMRQKEGLKAVAILPVAYKNSIIGSLNVASKSMDHIPEFSRTSLETISSHIGTAIITAKQDQALRESEARYRNILETMQDSVALGDADGYILDVNPAFEKTYQFTRAELIGMHPKEIVHPDYHDALDDYICQFKKSGSFSGETIDVRKDGSLIDTEVRGTALKVSGKECMLAVIRDITKRKNAEKAVIREKENFKTLIEKAPFGVTLVDKNGFQKYINSVFTKILGYESQDVPTIEKWLKLAFPDGPYRERVIAAWQVDFNAPERENPRHRLFTVRCKDGSDKEISFRMVKLASEDRMIFF